MTSFEQLAGGLGHWATESLRPRPTRNALVYFAAATLALVAVSLMLGPYRIAIFPDDALYGLTLGEYLRRGHAAYVDYFPAHPPAPFAFVALGLAVCGMSGWALVVAQASGAVVLGSIAFWLAIRRLGPTWAVLFAVFVELVLMAPVPLGYNVWRESTFAMWYNVFGFVQISMVFLLLAPANSGGGLGRAVDAWLAGLLLTGLFLTKLTFFLPAAATFVAGTLVLPDHRRSRWDGAGALVAAAVLLTAIPFATGLSVRGYLGYTLTLPLAVPAWMLPLRYVQFSRTLAFVAFALLMVAWLAGEHGVLRSMRRQWALALLMVATQAVAVSTASQSQELLPLIGLIPLLCLHRVGALVPSEQLRQSRPLVVFALLAALLTMADEPKNTLLGWGFSRVTVKTFKAAEASGSLPPTSPAARVLSSRVAPEFFSLLPTAHVERTVDALGLLARAGVKPGQTLFVAAVTDGITALTDLRFARGSSPWWALMLAPSPASVPLVEPNLLADADWLLRATNDPVGPSASGSLTWDYLQAHRGAFLKQNFVEVGRSPSWALYRRTDGLAPTNR